MEELPGHPKHGPPSLLPPANLRVADDTNILAVLLHLVKVSVYALLAGLITPALGRLAERLLLGAVPSIPASTRGRGRVWGCEGVCRRGRMWGGGGGGGENDSGTHQHCERSSRAVSVAMSQNRNNRFLTNNSEVIITKAVQLLASN